MNVMTAATLLILVMDPMGNVPMFASFVAGIEPRRARRIIFRELLIALAVLVLFLFAGRFLLELLHVSEPALSVSGGVILFLIALKMIFAHVRDIFPESVSGEPLIVPLAIPFVAGPSAIATVLLLMARDPSRWLDWLLALISAWFISSLILMASGSLSRWLGERGLDALQRLMGLLLITVAVQMSLTGLHEFFDSQ